MKRLQRIFLVAGLTVATTAHANYLTATVDALQVNLSTNAAFVRLTGLPTFDGSGCSNVWATGNLDDDKFMIYIWPGLMSAKSQGKSVSVGVSGCLNGYPRIEWIQVNAS